LHLTELDGLGREHDINSIRLTPARQFEFVSADDVDLEPGAGDLTDNRWEESGGYAVGARWLDYSPVLAQSD
jgi:hypothetical protein